MKSDEQKKDLATIRAQGLIGESKGNPLVKYRQLTAGSGRGWAYFTKYEFLTSVLCNMPGALGYFLRQRLYRTIFKSLGPGVAIGQNVRIRGAGGISLGRNVAIDDNVLLEARDGELIIGDSTIISRNVIISARGGKVKIGSNCSIGSNVRLGSASSLILEDYVLVAHGCYVGGIDHRHDRLDVPILCQGVAEMKGISIGRGAWLGAASCVLDGVSIGKDAIVGAMALVNKDVPDLGVAVGQPARVIKYRDGRQDPPKAS